MSRLRRILALGFEPNANLDDLLERLCASPSLASEIARVANTAPWGMEGRIDRLERVVLIQGSRTAAAIAAALLVRDQLRARFGPAEAERRFAHALETAVRARLVATRLELPLAHEAWVAGLLHVLDAPPAHPAQWTAVHVLVRAACAARGDRAGPLLELGLLADELPELRLDVERLLKDVAASLL